MLLIWPVWSLLFPVIHVVAWEERFALFGFGRSGALYLCLAVTRWLKVLARLAVAVAGIRVTTIVKVRIVHRLIQTFPARLLPHGLRWHLRVVLHSHHFDLDTFLNLAGNEILDLRAVRLF